MTAPGQGTPARRLTPDELRALFLFEDLDEHQLAWVADNGDVVDRPAGTEVSVEGEPAECFFVLLEGTLSMVRLVGGSEVETVRTSDRGVYSGAVQFYFGDRLEQRYPATVRAVTDCRFLALPAAPFAAVFRQWYPMAVHLLEGMFVGQRNSAELVGQRERLLALGKLTAGLTHELNNPAAAAARATAALRDRFAGMRHKLALLSEGRIDGAMLRALTGLQEEFVGRVAGPRELSALERSDLEDGLVEWLDDHEVGQSWELAGVFVAAGLGGGDLDRVADAGEPAAPGPAVNAGQPFAFDLATFFGDLLPDEIGLGDRETIDFLLQRSWYDEALDLSPPPGRSRPGIQIFVVEENLRRLRTGQLTVEDRPYVLFTKALQATTWVPYRPGDNR